MKKSQIIIIIIILISFAIGIYFYPHTKTFGLEFPPHVKVFDFFGVGVNPQLPNKFASHWNVQGQVDGYMSKFWGLFLMPIISIGLFLLFILIPKIDPLKANIAKFRKYFDWFIILIFLFLFYLYLLTIFWNLGKRFNIGQVLVPTLAILFYYAGILISHAERNWFIGIRTPWTLSSENVWGKTHKIGGKLFKIAAVISLIGLIFSKLAIWFVLGPVILVAIYTIVYSYFEYQREIDKQD